MQETLSQKSTIFAIGMLSKILKANFRVSGVEQLGNQPTLFVINHFTRAETFLIPYLLHKTLGEFVQTLADEQLFVGRFGEYLKNLGVVPTNEPGRDDMIIGDLMTGRRKWVIYPEGTMLKSKKILLRGRFSLTAPKGVGAAKSGAAALALKAEIYKNRYRRAIIKGDAAKAREMEERFGFESAAELAEKETVVVPVTISYYPLRPGDNAIKSLVKRFFREIPPRLEEELEIEGNILLSDTDIDIAFGEPIPMEGFISRHFFFSRWIPRFIRSIERNNFLLRHEANRLTRRFMSAIVGNLCINLDHLFAAGIRAAPSSAISAEHFHHALYNTARELRRLGKYRLHPSLGTDLEALAAGLPYGPAESILRLAEEKGICRLQDHSYHINHLQFEMLHMFHTVRIQNPLMVIANELEPLREVINILKANIKSSPELIREETADYLIRDDWDLFARDYELHRVDAVSPPRRVGAPYFLRGKETEIGVVLSHGFLAAPEEVRLLAELLHEQGFSVYVPRLRGHGTSPADLASAHWEDWERSYRRGFSVLRSCCSQIFLAGFSTGGVLALLGAGSGWPDISGVVAISSPHDLGDIRARLVPAVSFWNELLGKVRIGKGQIDYVDNDPENPEINYHKIPISGLTELNKLMDQCRAGLGTIDVPVLLLHARNDPTVNPKSSSKFLSAIGTDHKELVLIEDDHHGIVRREARFEIARQMDRFIRNCAASPRTLSSAS